MAVHSLVALIGNPSDEDLLVVRQAPPPPLLEEEYLEFVDSDLWDLPSAPLNLLDGDRPSASVIEGADSLSVNLDFGRFDVDSALDQVLSRINLGMAFVREWSVWKYVKEPEFGPGPPVNTLFIHGVTSKERILEESCKWLTKESALMMLRSVKPNSTRIGPFVSAALVSGSAEATNFRPSCALHYQEYPPGVILIPMKSRTREPFHTTNLVVVLGNDIIDPPKESSFIAQGNALLVDPGCATQFHGDLADLVAVLPRKLVVFVTHHHYDHVDGLSVIQKCNPDAVLLMHENTSRHIGKDEWHLHRTLISGGEKILIGNHQLQAIFAPGHTNGHLGLLHISTNSLIVGDHCVGHGSAVLDYIAGGNMKDYFQTTYRFLELSPHVLIPMHGRINLWPKRMLCGYLKNRRDRESSILKAIENGAETLYDIVSKAYPGLDVIQWLPASSNVRIHVDHLACRDKLPKEFSMRKFEASCKLHFISRWSWKYLQSRGILKTLALTGAASLAVAFAVAFGASNKQITLKHIK